MKVGNKEKCCEKDCKTPQEYMDNHFPLHIVDITEDEIDKEIHQMRKEKKDD